MVIEGGTALPSTASNIDIFTTQRLAEMYVEAGIGEGDIVGSVVADGTRYPLDVRTITEGGSTTTYRIGAVPSSDSTAATIFIDATDGQSPASSPWRYVLNNYRDTEITAIDLKDFG